MAGQGSSLNLLITSLVWRQDHNGFTHQDPGFLDLVVNKSPSVVRVYLPPDANCLLSVADHCLRSANYINVIIADKQVHLQYLDIDAAIVHCTKGAGVWSWASNDENAEPDIVMASCGDVPTMEALAATALLRQHLPDVKVRFVNVVDLSKLLPNTEHPHGLTDREFEALFTPDKPVVFNFHGYPWLIHRLTYRRPAQHNIHVRGYKEHGNINTPLELAIRNQTDRFSLAIDAIDRVVRFRATGSSAREALLNQQIACRKSRLRVRHRPARHHQLAVAVLKELMMTHDLESVALTLVADGKGILAADETVHTLTQRFDTLGIQSTEKSRCTYREMLFTAGVAEFISGVILYDETIRQKAQDGTPLVKSYRTRQAPCRASRSTQARSRCRAAPAKRSPKASTGCAIACRISRTRRPLRQMARGDRYRRTHPEPTPAFAPMRTRWRVMRRCARRTDIVPIVEPEVLMDGDHDIDTLRRGDRAGAAGGVPGALPSARRARRHGAEAQHGHCGQEVAAAGVVEEVATTRLCCLESPCARGSAGHRVFVGRPGRSGGYGPFGRNQSTCQDQAMEDQFFLRPRAAGPCAGDVAWPRRELSRGSASAVSTRPP